MDENFLLHTDIAVKLYHGVAARLPIIDYHNHINTHHLAHDHQFPNITDLWISTDPYKHRAMRINGVSEHYITGDADPREKFIKWSATVPHTAGNPLFHWTAMELRRIFDVNEMLSAKNAKEVWDHCNRMLTRPDFRANGIAGKFNIELITTSDELLDDLEGHRLVKVTTDSFEVTPSLRCDVILNFDERYAGYLATVKEMTGVEIACLDDLKNMLIGRLDHFHNNGCRLADHALDAGFGFDLPSGSQAEEMFSRLLADGLPDKDEVTKLRSHLLFFLGCEYDKRGWGLQLHIGAQRTTSSRLRNLVGPAGGFAAIGQSCDIRALCTLMDSLERAGHLPRTILYTLNPSDNEAFASVCGAFVQDGVPGKVQFGPAWWYNDHAEGIRRQLTATANYGLLSRFIGMTTDSRSILSLSRHEYFRRILCNLLAEWAASGMLPPDQAVLERLAADVSYYNIKNWLK